MASNNGSAKNPSNASEDIVITEVGEELSYVVTLFDSKDDAKKAYRALYEVSRDGFVDVLDAAYVEKTDRGRIKVHDHADWAVGGGVVAGGVTGAIIGLVAGTVLLPATIGVLVGGIIAGVHEHDRNFADRELRELAEDIPVGTAALVAVVEDPYLVSAEVEVKKLGGKKMHSGRVPKGTVDSLKTSKTSNSKG